MPLLPGLSTGVKHGTRLSATAIWMVLWAAKRAVIGEPLHRVRRADRAEALLDAANHHVADHLAGDAGGRRNPADDLAVVAIEREGDAHHLAVPAEPAPAEAGVNSRPSEHQRTFERIVAVFARMSATRVALEDEAKLLHQPVDALGVDRGHPVGSPLALEERGEPPVPVSGSRVDEAADISRQFQVALAGLRSAFGPHTLDALGDVRAREAQRVGDHCQQRHRWKTVAGGRRR
jgi:hypothetical protein